METVCDTIINTLEGAKHWTKYYYESKCERDAYVETFEQCQKIVKENDLNTDAMLIALSDFHVALSAIPKPPFFSPERWLYKPLKARDQAICTCYDLVESLSRRYLY